MVSTTYLFLELLKDFGLITRLGANRFELFDTLHKILGMIHYFLSTVVEHESNVLSINHTLLRENRGRSQLHQSLAKLSDAVDVGVVKLYEA